MSNISDANFKAFAGDGKVYLYPGQRVIKIGDRMFPVGVGNNSMPDKPVHFYKCAAIHGPYEVETVVVSGCPVAEVNGDYLPTEFTTSDWEGNKQPVYSNGTYFYYYEPNNYMGWGISSDYTSTTLLYMGSVGGSWSDADWNTVEGMSAVKGTYTMDADAPKTWDGYKAVLSNGVYTFEDELTTGLTYRDIKPVKYGIYNHDLSVKIDHLKLDYPTAGLVFNAPLTGDFEIAATGQDMESKNVELAEINGIKCAKFDNNSKRSYIKCYNSGLKYNGAKSFTMHFSFYLDSTAANGYLFGVGNYNTSETVFFYLDPAENENQRIAKISYGAANPDTDSCFLSFTVDLDTWYTLTLVINADEKNAPVYLGKEKLGVINQSMGLYNETIMVGTARSGDSFWGSGYVRNVLVYNRALSESEIERLVDKFGNPVIKKKIVVSGAGSDIVNGEYFRNDTVSTDAGREVWVNSGNTLYCFQQDGKWYIGVNYFTSYMPVYYQSDTGPGGSWTPYPTETDGVYYGKEPNPVVTMVEYTEE